MSLFLCTGVILDLFHIPGQRDDLIEFWNKRVKGFNDDL